MLSWDRKLGHQAIKQKLDLQWLIRVINVALSPFLLSQKNQLSQVHNYPTSSVNMTAETFAFNADIQQLMSELGASSPSCSPLCACSRISFSSCHCIFGFCRSVHIIILLVIMNYEFRLWFIFSLPHFFFAVQVWSLTPFTAIKRFSFVN